MCEKCSNLLAELNPEQKEAVIYTSDPQLIIAGAGSGKTRVITHKIAYLIQEGMSAHNILALTFTNKAAGEMTDRTLNLLGIHSLNNLWIGTFHSIAAKILRIEIDNTVYRKGFTIYDTNDTKSIVKQITKEHNFNDKIFTPSFVLNRISKAKSLLVGPGQYLNDTRLRTSDSLDVYYGMATFYDFYQKRLLENNAMDFDDLLFNLHTLLISRPEICEKYRQLFQYILIDEYQDTNYIQNVLTHVLAKPMEHLCVVGDDAQSIYSFRGADINNILTFMQVYPNAKLFKLQRNYRSTQNIVNVANDIIARNKGQIPKRVISQNEEGEKLGIYVFSSDKDEGEGVVRIIRRCIEDTSRGNEDFAILYRTNSQSRLFETALRKWDIAYRIYGSVSFFQRKEIKDVLAYVRVIVNEQDNEAMLRIINFPKRGIGASTVEVLERYAIENGLTLFHLITHLKEYRPQLSKATLTKVCAFGDTLLQVKEAISELDALQAILYVLDQFKIIDEFRNDEDTIGTNDRGENVNELVHAVSDFVSSSKSGTTDLAQFLQDISLYTSQDDFGDDNSAKVTLMTIHSAKGLEFDNVFVTGLEENLFPSAFCSSEEEIEEERRLFYVAVTRSKKSCCLSYARMRFKNGSLLPSTASRFVRDLDKKYIQIFDRSFFVVSRKEEALEMDCDRGNADVSVRSPIATSFKINDRVYHNTFGKGIVKDIYGESGTDKIVVAFDQYGHKVLLLKYAKLVVI